MIVSTIDKNCVEGSPNDAFMISSLVEEEATASLNSTTRSWFAKEAPAPPRVENRSLIAPSIFSSSALGPQIDSLMMSLNVVFPDISPGSPPIISPAVSSALQIASPKTSQTLIRSLNKILINSFL